MEYHFEKIKDGMSELELLNLCDDKSNHPIFRGAPYWTAEIYSFGKYIRQYGYYPKFLPLAIYTDHGPARLNGPPYKHELEATAPVMFYHSPESVKIWKSFSKKPCFILFSPFVFYRRKNNIVRSNDANGTIVFVNHVTEVVKDISDMQVYINQLKDLPQKFQPVSVCLHPTDIKQGRYKIFMCNNISVYTAGAGNSKHFAERFYNILKKFKFASSNLVGSSMFYSVEMGIPFFVYGNKPKNVNDGDSNLPFGKYDFYEGREYFQTLDEMFSDLDCEINVEKKKIVETDLGIYEGISRLKMAVVLYTSLFRWMFSAAFYKWLLKSFKRVINKKV